jgi:hypothetical protein
LTCGGPTTRSSEPCGLRQCNSRPATSTHSALDLDIYAWLAQRLHRIPKGKPQTITWQALKSQFGPDYDRLRKFREKFVLALKGPTPLSVCQQPDPFVRLPSRRAAIHVHGNHDRLRVVGIRLDGVDRHHFPHIRHQGRRPCWSVSSLICSPDCRTAAACSSITRTSRSRS